MGKHAQSIDSQILQRVKIRGRGWVFTASNFVELGSRDAVDETLSRQSQGGIIRKLTRGTYDYPRKDAQLGSLSPSIWCRFLFDSRAGSFHIAILRLWCKSAITKDYELYLSGIVWKIFNCLQRESWNRHFYLAGHSRRIRVKSLTPRSSAFSSRPKVLVCSGVILFRGGLTPSNIMHPGTVVR